MLSCWSLDICSPLQYNIQGVYHLNVLLQLLLDVIVSFFSYTNPSSKNKQSKILMELANKSCLQRVTICQFYSCPGVTNHLLEQLSRGENFCEMTSCAC